MCLISYRVAIDKLVGKTFYFLGGEGELKHLGRQGWHWPSTVQGILGGRVIGAFVYFSDSGGKHCCLFLQITGIPSIHLPNHPYKRDPSSRSSIHHPSTRPPIYLSINLLVHLSITHPSIHLVISPCIQLFIQTKSVSDCPSQIPVMELGVLLQHVWLM